MSVAEGDGSRWARPFPIPRGVQAAIAGAASEGMPDAGAVMGESVRMRPPRVIALASTAAGPEQARLGIAFGVALRRRGARVAVLETDLEHGRLAQLVGLRGVPTSADVLAGRCPLADAVAPGPEGVDVLGGSRGGSNRLGAAAQRRLLEQVDALAGRYDLLVLVPAADRSVGTRFVIGAAHATAVIVPADRPAHEGTLATLRSFSSSADDPLGIVMHGTADAASGQSAYAALVRSTRFGALARLAYVGWLPADGHADLGRRAEEGPVTALVERWGFAPPARPRGGLQFCFEPLLAAQEAA